MTACAVTLLFAFAQFAQSMTGELRLTVSDPAGLPLPSHVTLVSEANHVEQMLETGVEGVVVAKRLPFGRYQLEVTQPGFATHSTLLDIQSALPIDYHVTLTLASVQTQVTVTPDATLLDVRQTSTVNRIGEEMLRGRIASLPGRSLSDVVNTQPGWLQEANGILHPRGSEYQVQYVVDGLPLTDNRSSPFAPELDASDVHAMSIITSGYPAEYGRKLGGVIEVVTAGTARRGFHGSAEGSAGSFGTLTGAAGGQYGWLRSIVGVNGSVLHTDRYLDPPVEENFSNSGTGATLAAHFEREFSAADRLGVVLRHGHTRFLVPNEHVQEEAGQRQERSNRETAAQVSYQHVFSPTAIGDVRAMARTLTADLSSNASSTPIIATQDRGVRNGYVKASISAHVGAQEWKAGIDGDFGRIREAFAYALSDPTQFDPATRPRFSFADRHVDREHAIFVQDRIAIGAWTVNAGVRWDAYSLLVRQNALSPRLAVAWSWPRADVVLRASYDRAFQTPAIENLLLASSSAVDSVSTDVLRLPVRPSIGDFLEVGVSQRLFSKFRLDLTQFNREMSNFADDDVLLNTGVSFPIALHHANIRGTEVKLELTAWRKFSGFVSYAHMAGTGSLPITGGLLLGDDVEHSLASTERLPISQDQRNTVRGRLGYQFSSRASAAAAVSYGSGLPVELSGDVDQATIQYGSRIVDRVDFERNRVRPSASIDASFSYVVFKTDRRRVRVQADVANVTNRLNVINFAGLFSGTALAPPRSLMVRIQSEF